MLNTENERSGGLSPTSSEYKYFLNSTGTMSRRPSEEIFLKIIIDKVDDDLMGLLCLKIKAFQYIIADQEKSSVI